MTYFILSSNVTFKAIFILHIFGFFPTPSKTTIISSGKTVTLTLLLCTGSLLVIFPFSITCSWLLNHHKSQHFSSRNVLSKIMIPCSYFSLSSNKMPPPLQSSITVVPVILTGTTNLLWGTKGLLFHWLHFSCCVNRSIEEKYKPISPINVYVKILLFVYGFLKNLLFLSPHTALLFATHCE